MGLEKIKGIIYNKCKLDKGVRREGCMPFACAPSGARF